MKQIDNIIKAIVDYQPFNEQEQKDKNYFLDKLQYEKDLLTRTNENFHLSASAWVVNQNFDKVLMVYHNIYQSYSWSGGHVDGCSDLIHVASKELEEETGIQKYSLLSEDLFAFDILDVKKHKKHGKLIKEHMHINFTYLFQADDKQDLIIKPDENSDVCWISIRELNDKVEEAYMLDCYNKLIEKAKLYKTKRKEV
ncbi:8-oxo-dGTP pyrophosphatase MutT (NUDIX family) [Breznakia sp. PF5-3]|uniref:NUDIX hydrolase n=1 Tax=unclassified Breznakia TaxID=2623764 RepID=UPI002405D6EE|nr:MULTISPECIES: NUDIX hydrolase [unclassified Breznakia]MDF9824857.1 8-oxo-dGTP pyrophosphatase MutT (NUDIX family) [Breznakia sp. PM6-1]MDF9835714.1 8-oxo-dGTP pyrophosphatase MutT (NUDIX family) [Breznakia sp. PF5-3]MDF9838274.1 8-oxo-dGTP pyrophosphatase MutT (NUDIX family) [Breznakia sp. PFB2-8]MDF9860287.1 8-oxo-dGTP pyrophosphatase MutT (NUDIX family) [Breznakia sp. PH5-24]